MMPRPVLKAALAGALLLASAGLSAAPPSLGGMWDAIVVVNKTEIPFRFEIAGDGANVRGWFFDGDLKMNSTRGRFEDDGTLVLEFAQLGTTLTASLKEGSLEGSYSRGKGVVICDGHDGAATSRPTIWSHVHDPAAAILAIGNYGCLSAGR